MKTQFATCGLLALFMLAACNHHQQTSEITSINIVDGIKNPTELKVSDLGKTIRYIALETTDSCLIGNDPQIKVWNDKLLIYTSTQCMLFDKETGKFIGSIGHKGDDPEAYNSTTPHLNALNQLLYFSQGTSKLVKYDQRGKYAGTITIPTSYSTSPNSAKVNRPSINGFLFSDSTITGHYVGGLGEKCPSSVLSFTESGVFIDTIPQIIPELGTGQIDDIVSISVRKGFGLLGGFINVQYANGKQSICAPSHAAIWQNRGEVHLKELFSDTIYTIKGNKLENYMTFHTGKYHWPASERVQTDNNNDRVLISYTTENEHILYFQFIKGIYTEKSVLYNGVYNKQSKTVTTALAEKAFTDDLTHFMPFVPTYLNETGEYASLIQASDAFTWLEENPKSKVEEKLATLKGLDEESNPIVVLVN